MFAVYSHERVDFQEFCFTLFLILDLRYSTREERYVHV